MKIDIKENNIFIMSSLKLKKVYEKAFYPIAKELQLTQGEIDVLLFLFNNKPFDTAKDIAKYRSLSKSMVSMSINRLIRKSYLSCKTDLIDKRNIHLSIEAISLPIIEKLLAVQNNFLSFLFKDITEEELQVMKHVFGKIDENISKEYEINLEEEKDGKNKGKRTGN